MSDTKARRAATVQQVSATLRSPAALIAAGLAPPAAVETLAAVAERFAVAVPPALAALIDPADPADPIARQFIPSALELAVAPEELADPIGDDAFSPLKGVVHRYPDRVLLKPVLVCPVYCRFCFRREQVGEGALSPAETLAALSYVAARPELREVILTGGDPLMLAPRRLAALMRGIGAIPHVELVRVHTRLPIAAPERVTPALARALKASGRATWLAVHVNHPRELSVAATAALGRLADAGLPLLSQTVLLKGVNDDAATLEALFRALIRHRVRPYYLHHPDRARGTAHFRPSLAEGRALMRALRGRLSGIAQPTYVLDIPGGAGKVPVGPDYWDETAGQVADRDGNRHRY